jgi:hypothetical protein
LVDTPPPLWHLKGLMMVSLTRAGYERIDEFVRLYDEALFR